METTIMVTECRRSTVSKNGNPRFIITDSKGNTYRTAPDSGGSYNIVDGRTGMAQIHTDRKGQITDFQYV